MRASAILALAALTLSAPAVAEEEGVEATFVACLADKQPELIAKIRDAESQEGFESAMKTALEVCPTETDKMSMGRLFKALNAHKQSKNNA